MRSFIETNALIYADASDAGDKQARASAVVAQCLRDGSGVISTQVLHEFVNAAVRKLALPLDLLRALVRLCSRFETVNASAAAVLDALDLHALNKISFWDALIVQAARQSGCEQLLTQDRQAGAVLAGVRIVKPFDVAMPRRPPRSRPKLR